MGAIRILAAAFCLLLPLQASRADAPAAKTETATFAGGCFWCMVPPFKNLPGVISVTSGYTGGHVANPSYEQVSAGDTGHAESVQIVYDPAKIDYPKLLDVYWHNVDPTTPARQFCDSGDQYRTAIFFHSPEQQSQAEQFKRELEQAHVYSKPIATQIVAAPSFYQAENYHQQYLEKRGLASCHIGG